MTTLATMKTRIADEISRSDMTTQIGYAITSAIEKYQKTRFYFNEASFTTLQFTTVAAQETYTTENALLPYVYDVDDLFVTVSGNNFRVKRIDPTHYVLNELASSSGQPYQYMWVNQTFYLSPVPDDAYTMSILGHYKLAAPAADDTADNKWMTDAERLIRSCAKRMLYQDILLDADGVGACAQAEQEALDDLKATSNQMQKLGVIQPTSF